MLNKNLPTVHLKDALHSHSLTYLHTHIHTHLGISGYSAAHCCVPSCYTASLSHTGWQTHVEKSHGHLENNMYMFAKDKVLGIIIMQRQEDIRPLVWLDYVPSVLFVKEPHSVSWKQSWKMFSLVKCSDPPSGLYLVCRLQNSPRPLRNLLTPLCSVSGSSSRYCSTLCSNRPVTRQPNITTTNKLFSRAVCWESMLAVTLTARGQCYCSSSLLFLHSDVES